MRSWGDGNGVVQLVLTDQAVVPGAEELDDWLHAATEAGDGVHTVRTGALFPDAAACFGGAGFTVVDSLALLELTFGAATATPGATPVTARTGSLPARRHQEAATIDRRAFGSSWAHDGDDLAEIRTATPHHVARGRYLGGRFERGPLVAFAITGAASGQGYLQRLAVDPTYQCGGHGRALTLDSLAWMRRRRLRSALVNTSVDNTPALALYHSVGFQRRPETLLVMQLAVRAQQ